MEESKAAQTDSDQRVDVRDMELPRVSGKEAQGP